MKKKNELWRAIEVVIKLAKYQTWDECHKIYLVMDEKQAEKMKSWGYSLVKPDITLLHEWFDNSCPLRFIDAVSSVEEGQDSNKGYTTLIGQCE